MKTAKSPAVHRTHRTRHTALALAAASVLSPWLAAPASAASVCTWVPSSGNWGATVNWSCGVVPTGPASDTANIGAGKLVTINDLDGSSNFRSIFTLNNAGTLTLDAFGLNLQSSGSTANTGTINVGGVSTAALQVQGGHNVNNAGGVINIGAGSVLNQFGSTFAGGVINTVGTGAFVAFNSNANLLSGVTLNGRLDMATNTGIERVTGGLTLGGSAATVNVNANSVLSFVGDQTLGGTGTVVLGNTGGSNRALSMEGNTVLTLGANIVVRGENGTLGQTYLAGGTQSIINNGRISADVSGGTVSLAPANGTTNNGILEAQNGGTLVLNSDVIGGASGSIVAGAGSTVIQNGVTLSGVVNASGTGVFRAANSNSNFLSGVTFNGPLDLASATSVERVVGGLTLNGTININANSVLSFVGDQTLGGTGTVVLGNTGGSNRALSMQGDTVLTLGANIVVRGENGTLGQAYLAGGTQSIINNGRISADVSGGTVSLAPANGITNNGVLEAKNGGTLVLNSNVTGTLGSHIDVGAGSTIVQNGVSLNGLINTAGGGSFRPSNSNSNFFTSATFNGSLDMASGTSIERVVGGLTLNGAINLNANSVLSFAGDQTLGGTGTVVLGNTGGSNRALSMQGDTVLTLGANIVVRGENGTIGLGYLAGGTQSLVNNGRISADVSGGTISLAPSNGTTNNGILEAQNGGTLVLNSAVAGSASGSIVAGAGSTVIQNGVSLSGVINSAGSGVFRVANSNSNFLNGVTFNGPLDLASGTSVERVTNGLTLNGAIDLNANSVLSFAGSQALNGNGTITLGNTGGSNRALSMEGDMTLTVGAGILVHGKNGTVGQPYLAGGAQVLVNNGSILADVAGGLIDLSAAQTNNAATLGAANGGTLRLNNAVTNTGAGHIDAADGSTVIQNGVTVTGGTINSTGSGRFTPSNSNSNFLTNVTLAGVIDMASGTTVERVTNGLTMVNGGVEINSNSVLSFIGTQILGGTGAVVLGNTGASNRALSLEGDMTLTVGAGVLVHGVNGTLGQAYLSGGTQNLINNGTINSDGGGIITVGVNGALTNNGTLRAQSGTLGIQNGLSGTGTLQVDAAGTMSLSNVANTQGKLVMGAAGSTLNIGTQNLTITNDYTNVAAGSGDSFNKRAGIVGAGLVMAGGNAAQAVTGSAITGGNTATPTLTLGNVRVGATTFNYQIANVGTTGPSLRGAIQTGVNGGNISDARLSGSGVSQGLYNTGAPASNSGDLAVTFTTASAGPIAALSGQKVNLLSNFSNIASQTLSIVLGSGAAAYNAAVGSATPSSVTVAAQRVGGSNTVALTVANTAVAGPFSEDLNASFGSFTGGATGSGSIAGRLAGSNNTGTGAMSVGVNTSTSGVKIGTAVLAYQTAGTVNNVSNGLGVASVGGQTVNVSGNVYAPAVKVLNTTAVNFGIVRVGESVAAKTVTVSNTASGALTDTLSAALSGGIAPFTAGGSVSVAAGASNSSGLTVALNTATAGVFSGSGTVTFASHNPELADLALGTAGVTLNAQVNNLAASTLAKSSGLGTFGGGPASYTLNFGSIFVGDTGGSALLALTNSASGPADALAGSFNLSALQAGDPFALSGFASFSGLAASSTLSGLTVNFSGTTAGNYDRVIVLNRVSTNGVEADLGLTSVQLHLQGTVVAVPEPGEWAMWLAGLGVLGAVVQRRRRAAEVA